MPTSSAPTTPGSSNLHSLILRRIARVTATKAAAAISRDDSHMSRIMSGERGIQIQELESFFKAIGLRVIECDDAHTVTISSTEYHALKYLAHRFTGS